MPDFAVRPFDEANPLGLSAAAPGYLPADQRAPQRDPDLGWSPDMVQGYTGQADTRTPEQYNADQQPLIDWGNMDETYWTPREQDPTPLILGALGAIAAPFALSALGVGGAAGAAGGAGGAASGLTPLALSTAPTSLGITAPSVLGSLGGAAAGTGALAAGAGTGSLLDAVVVLGSHGLTAAEIGATLGIPAATAGAVLSGGAGSDTLVGNQGADVVPHEAQPAYNPNGITADQVVVNGVAPTASSVNPALLGAGALGAGALALGAGGGGGTPFDPNSLGVGDAVQPPVSPPASTTPPKLLDAIKSGDPSQIGSWIAANPLQAIQLGLLAGSAVATVAGGGSGGSTPSGTYKSVDLPASFSATSPHFALAGRGTPRVMPAQDWTKYGQGPEQSFFTGVTQPAPATNLTVTPAPAKGFAKGGFAVRGEGDGRSDSIRANLSDGEYVMDAETVSMLGNGSSKAGADKLDQFRVSLRKDKGRNLARGDFSVHAKEPAAYMTRGR